MLEAEKTEELAEKTKIAPPQPPTLATPWQRWRPVLLLIVVVASWASASVVTKYVYLHQIITPFTLVVGRFTLAGCFALFLFSLSQRRRQVKTLPFVGGWRAYWLGGTLITTFIIGFNLALLYISATLGGLVFFALTPLVMLVVGHFWLDSVFGWRQAIGISVALFGVIIVLSGGDPQHLLNSLTGTNLPLGLALMSISALGWGAYGLWGKRYPISQPGASLLSTGLNQLVGVAPVWVLYWLFEPNGLFILKPEAWLFILYIGIVPSCLGFALFNAILKDLNLNQAATIQLFSPVFTAFFAILFLDEPFSLALVIGTLVLLWGIRITTRIKKPSLKAGNTN